MVLKKSNCVPSSERYIELLCRCHFFEYSFPLSYLTSKYQTTELLTGEDQYTVLQNNWKLVLASCLTQGAALEHMLSSHTSWHIILILVVFHNHPLVLQIFCMFFLKSIYIVGIIVATKMILVFLITSWCTNPFYE